MTGRSLRGAQAARADLLVVSNGHGEDLVAGRVVGALLALEPGLRVHALPVVGCGPALARSGAQLVGPRRELPSGGLTMHSAAHLVADLRGGLVGLTARQVAWLARTRPRAAFVVGDFYAHALAALTRAPRRVLQTLVSVHHGLGGTASPGRYFMERFRRPELALMRRSAMVYVRDAATARHLRGLGLARVAYLGNPMMDGLEGRQLEGSGDAGGPRVALLPGSRAYALRSVTIMVAALERLPGALGLVAWTGRTPPAPPAGWESDVAVAPGVVAAWRNGATRLWWVVDRFADVLRSADVAVGTAGTAVEQAVGLGVPVVTFPLAPDHSAAFVANQARLLGAGVTQGVGEPAALASTLARLWRDEGAAARARAAGAERMGPPGASAALAADLRDWLKDLAAADASVGR